MRRNIYKIFCRLLGKNSLKFLILLQCTFQQRKVTCDALLLGLTINTTGGVSLVDTPQEIYDAWGTALDYRYVAGENYPELVSAGPDKIFGNADDITNRSK